MPTLDLVAPLLRRSESDQILDGGTLDHKLNDPATTTVTLIYSSSFTRSKVRKDQYLSIAAKRPSSRARATERQAHDAYLGVINGIARVAACGRR